MRVYFTRGVARVCEWSANAVAQGPRQTGHRLTWDNGQSSRQGTNFCDVLDSSVSCAGFPLVKIHDFHMQVRRM